METPTITAPKASLRGPKLWKRRIPLQSQNLWSQGMGWTLYSCFALFLPLLGRPQTCIIIAKTRNKPSVLGWWIDNTNCVISNDRKAYSNKKEPTIDRLNNLDESQMHDAEWKKPISKGLHVILDSIYTAFCKRQKYNDREHISDCQRLEVNDLLRGS